MCGLFLLGGARSEVLADSVRARLAHALSADSVRRKPVREWMAGLTKEELLDVGHDVYAAIAYRNGLPEMKVELG